jgi:hypothetical protein
MVEVPMKTPIASPARAAKSCTPQTAKKVAGFGLRFTIGYEMMRKRQGRARRTGSSAAVLDR